MTYRRWATRRCISVAAMAFLAVTGYTQLAMLHKSSRVKPDELNSPRTDDYSAVWDEEGSQEAAEQALIVSMFHRALQAAGFNATMVNAETGNRSNDKHRLQRLLQRIEASKGQGRRRVNGISPEMAKKDSMQFPPRAAEELHAFWMDEVYGATGKVAASNPPKEWITRRNGSSVQKPPAAS
mmetsp:Transcript_43631/g.59595  ORF Transcript_43631/g.59595 Transcript_43631/m.59595 type:complete len:182 (-) Transcript_43631:369-914(-)